MSVHDRYLHCIEEVAETCCKQGRDPREVQMIAVSKYYPSSLIQEAYTAGCRAFGESRVQEFSEKQPLLPKDICWHMIGSLQRKKVPGIIGAFSLIHSVDSLELAQKISQASQNIEQKTAILIQVNTSGEASKQGCTIKECLPLYDQLLALPGIEVQGLMTMAPLTKNSSVLHRCFADLRILKERLEATGNKRLAHLSMGMSNDYAIAIAEGATLLRIGTRIFGPSV